MTRPIKKIMFSVMTLISGVNFSLLATAEASAKAEAYAVTVYAGPQSVSPSKPIHVTVEAVDAAGASLDNVQAVLSYKSDDTVKTVTAALENGLVSFNVPAQKKSGHMTFWATVSETLSNEALIAVTAGAAQQFSLRADAGQTAQSVALSSPVIRDEFGNPISDLSPVLIDWIDEAGLKARQTILLSNGRVSQTIKCPARIEGALRLTARLGSLQYTLPKLNALCGLGAS